MPPFDQDNFLTDIINQSLQAKQETSNQIDFNNVLIDLQRKIGQIASDRRKDQIQLQNQIKEIIQKTMQQMDCVSLTQVIELVYMMIMIKQLSSLPIFQEIAKIQSAKSQPSPSSQDKIPHK